MSLIQVQKLARGRLLSGGRVYIGEYGSNEPEVNPITVYTDYLFQNPVSAGNGFPLDRDGYPVLNGVRVNLYSAVNYSFQLKTRRGTDVFPEARQINISAGSEQIDKVYDVIGVGADDSSMGPYESSVPDNESIKQNVEYLGGRSDELTQNSQSNSAQIIALGEGVQANTTLVNENQQAIAANRQEIEALEGGQFARPLDELLADDSIPVDTDIGIQSLEYVTGSGVGAGLYKKVSVNPGFPLINPPTNDGNYFAFQPNGDINIFQAGAISDFNGAAGTDISPILKECSSYSYAKGIKKVSLPAGDFLVTEAGSFNIDAGGVISGFAWVGAGLDVTNIYFRNSEPLDDNYLVDNQNKEQFIEYSNMSFFGDEDNNNSRWLRMDNGTGSQAQSPRHFNCRFKYFERIMICQGGATTSETVWSWCKFTQMKGEAFILDNVQSLNHNFLGCDIELTSSDIFVILSGGIINVWGGSIINNGGYMIRTDGNSAAIGTNNWTYNFYGIKTELRNEGKLLKMSSAGGINFTNSHIAVITGDEEREIAEINGEAMVNYTGGTIAGVWRLKQVSASTWAAPNRVATLNVNDCLTANNFEYNVDTSGNSGGNGRVSIRGGKVIQSSGTITTRYVDTDLYFDSGFSGRSAPIKTAIVCRQDGKLPRGDLPDSSNRSTIILPFNANIRSVRLIHESEGATKTQTYNLENLDASIVYKSWTIDVATDVNSRDEIFFVADNINDQTLVLRGDAGNDTNLYNGRVEIEYI